VGIVIVGAFLLTPLACVFLLNTSIKKLSLADERGSGGISEVISVPKISYSADLRRLGNEHQRLLAARDLPGRVGRLHAVERAYDDTLRAACRALDLETPPSKLDAVTRLQVEADLMLHGLDW
jgi:hypothetical protein